MNEKQIMMFKQFFKDQFPYQAETIEKDLSKVKVKEGGFITLLLRIFRCKGICFFRTIRYVRGSVKSEEDMLGFLARMLTYMIQYRREGVLAFPFKYMANLIKNGRKKNKFDEEASYCAKMFKIRHNIVEEPIDA